MELNSHYHHNSEITYFLFNLKYFFFLILTADPFSFALYSLFEALVLLLNSEYTCKNCIYK